MRPVKRNADDLVSAVIVRCKNGFEAVLRFKNPKDDLIVRHQFKSVLYWLIEERVR